MGSLTTALEWLEPIIPLVMLISLRVGVALSAMPAPFGDLAPMKVRAALAFMIGFALATPLIGTPAAIIDDHPVLLLRAAGGEVLVGAVIGVTVRVILAAISVAGTAVGFSSGLAFAQSLDPAFGESMTPVARAMGTLGIAFFLAMNGHHVVLDALSATIRTAPPGDVFGALELGGIVSIGGTVVAHGLRMSAPVVATMFIVQLGMALTSRAAPRVQIFQLTFAVAVSSGLLLLYVATPSLAPAIAAEIRSLPTLLASVFQGAP
ncbi:MAG: flagellar biosynthetic protein FliR [Polyangiales bacterium]